MSPRGPQNSWGGQRLSPHLPCPWSQLPSAVSPPHPRVFSRRTGQPPREVGWELPLPLSACFPTWEARAVAKP